MKKLRATLSTLLIAVLLLSTLGITVSASADDIPYDAFVDYGQQIVDIPSSEGIRIDGVVSEGEYACEPLVLDKDSPGMNWLDWTQDGFPEEELPEILPYSIKYYVTYDKKGLYIAAEIVEASLYTRCARPQDMWGTDSLEIDVSVDAYGDIPKGNFTQRFMMDRLRTNYCLWDDGSGSPVPTGLCYTPSTYGGYQVLQSMGEETFMITRNEEKQLTTYEVFFYWDELYFMDDGKIPEMVFLNLQLHLGDERYMEYVLPDYIACLGGLRYAVQLTDEQKAEVGTDTGMALHIFRLVDAKRINGEEEESETEAPTEAPTEALTEALTETPTEVPIETSAEVPTEALAEIHSETLTDAPETEGRTSGCGAVLGGMLTTLGVALAAAYVLSKRE